MTFDMALFDNAAMGIFKAKHQDLPVLHSDIWDEVLEQFKVNDLNPDGAVGELNRFALWIVTWKLDIHTAMIDRIKISLQVPMGSGFMSIQLEAGFPITFGEEGGIETEATPKMINDTAIKLSKQVFSTFEHIQKFGKVSAAPTTSPAQSPQSSAMNTQPSPAQSSNNREVGSVERVVVDSLVVGSADGKTNYRLKGGWFQAYGAPVYPETFAAAGIDVSGYPIGVHPFPRTVDVQRVTDKKIKVIKIY